MNDPDHDREQEIFLACLREPDPSAREERLALECGDDTALREAVERLLQSQEDAGSFLEAPFELTGAPTTATISTAELDAMVGATIGPYKLREKLGEGGMGVVFVAEQKRPVRRKVAIKVVKPGLASKEVIARFEAERQALALMDHPNIAKVLDAGVTETGRPYFAMDLVQGLAITKYCDKRRLGIRARLELFGQVCRAVQHAHQKGIIHRDLKPSNVLVAEIDGVAVPKVIDFGVAKAVGQKLTDQSVYTQFWQLIGTPLYMSPEQAGFGVIDVDTRSDVYSLGVLLYELLSGTTPLEKQLLKELGYDELRRRIREEDPPRPSVRLSTLEAKDSSTIADAIGLDQRDHSRLLRGELDWIVMRALEKDRSRRYESPSAFAADIDRYLNDQPVEACPPSRWYQLRKLATKHKSSLSTAAIVLIALLTATGVSLWQAKEANEARKLADQRLAQADTNYQHALNAVEQMLQRVGSHELATTPKMLVVQHELLENAISFYEQLIEENPTDPHVYFLASQAYGSLHEVASRMSNRDLDSEHCLKSVTLAKQALSMKPGSHDYAGQLADSYHRLAYSNRSRDPVYAEAMYREWQQ